MQHRRLSRPILDANKVVLPVTIQQVANGEGPDRHVLLLQTSTAVIDKDAKQVEAQVPYGQPLC